MVPLDARLRAGGVVAPRTTIAEAKRAGLPLPLACALLEKESAGGHNVFGHDNSIFAGAGAVTKAKYLEYKRQRGTRHMQGVGPTQLTWWELQDAADREGGCWRPEINMRVGFRHLAELIARYGESDGARRYNGTGDAAVAYSRDLLTKARRWEQILAGAPAGAAGPRLVHRGDHGPVVRRLTRRLSFVHSPSTGAPYLDGARARLDAEAEAALMAFQRDHRLDDDGVFGPRTARRLRRAVEHEKAARGHAGGEPAPVPGPAPHDDPPPPVRETVPREVPGGAPPPHRDPGGAAPPVRREPAHAGALATLARQATHADHRSDVALDDLLAYGGRLRRALERAARPPAPAPRSEVVAILLRIEHKLDALGEARRPEPSPGEPMAAAPVEVVAATAAVATVSKAAPPPPPVTEGPVTPHGATNGDLPAPAPAGRSGLSGPSGLSGLSDQAIAHRIRELDREIDAARALLVARFAAYDAQLARLRPAAGAHRPRPARRVRRPAPPVEPPVPPVLPLPGDPGGGAVVALQQGDHGHIVRSSKRAMVRYLAVKGSQEHASLRRALRREARSRKAGPVAGARWEEGVRAVQHLARRPVTGVMDGELQRMLERYWPHDSIARRAVRGTPAWRAIPGQLSPNFNVREFACKDGTPYIDGLVREQGLTKAQAKQRARQLAIRVERVRRADGNRALLPTSAFRTKAHNAKQPGAVPNSSHLRGFAIDIPPPVGVTLERHHKNMRAAFERGCGYYPAGKGYFVHGDFDPGFPHRDW